ncbi:MAG: branched-chain amino acid ABC transporter permease [Bosea sp. (in: a-proteobacteria)]|jgi:branched-chain amino acid transport system permease protein|uniref:branched-chain amino acid ABC transporter permease n=1 Tax=unclassified Bosea (in: a-proteobacteria) TaxID=2653178 RepID=UPI0008559205|nr:MULTISPECIES: branched-chain amino acid ABC transporter permease [unclassified Bosea (in: a-proteobacteria)]AOG06266.1 branched-chain amino acid transport system / permease component family protein [Bosea sp. RAC05]MDP3601716.1 branched-chain amino acid ABC transporter permease [Bosea sp. (in: a-proteobacteria)]WRH58435.1 MAG: branched-chain amino acid ABC transporter permease [Bosea sp. (in: a-proteobacteria)]
MLIEILQQTINGLAIGGVYVLIALGLTTVFGILGIAHFAHGSISMFGGYLTYFLMTGQGLPLIAAIPIALVAGVLLGVLVEMLAYRPVRHANHINAFIVALGLTMMVEGINLQFFGHEQIVIPTTLSRVFDINGVTVPELRLYVILSAILLVVAMMIFVEKTKTGQAIRAVAENRDAAILMGVNVTTIPLIVFGISTALGVAAGIMVGALFAIAPGIGEGLVVKGFAVLILGGLGSFPGAILGGTVLGITESIAAGFISSAYKDVIAFAVMIIVLLVRPQGLLGRAP